MLWLWLLSGVPVGLALMWMPPSGLVACFAVFILLDLAHTLSPIVLAWAHAGFRSVMLGNPRKYVALPSIIFAAGAAVSIAAAIGWTSYEPGPGQIHRATGWDNPLPIMFGVYFAWNFYHFSMQNYGVLRLCGVDLGRWGKLLAFVVTAIGIKTVPLAVSVNHWVVEIGLGCRASRRGWVFAAGLLLLTPVAFLWVSGPTPYGIALKPLEGTILALYGVRLTVGFVHFCYSRWVWKLSDPHVRATIGRDLLSVPRSCT